MKVKSQIQKRTLSSFMKLMLSANKLPMKISWRIRKKKKFTEWPPIHQTKMSDLTWPHFHTGIFRMCDSKNWLHDPSVILSSFAQYDVSYLGKTYARGVGDRRDAERARQGEFLLFSYFLRLLLLWILLHLSIFLPNLLEGNFGKRHLSVICINCREFVIKKDHVEIYQAPLYSVRYPIYRPILSHIVTWYLSYTVAIQNSCLICVKEVDGKFR